MGNKRLVTTLSILLSIGLLSFSGCTYHRVQSDDTSSTEGDSSESERNGVKTSDSTESSEGAQESVPADQGNDYQMDLYLDTENHTIYGTVTITIQNESDEDWQNLCFRDYSSIYTESASGYECDDAQLTDITDILDLRNHEKLTLTRSEDPSVVYVDLGMSLSAGESMKLSFSFVSYVPQTCSRYGYFLRDSGSQSYECYNLGNFYPILAVYTDSGWSTEPYIFMGECFNSVCSDYDVTVTAPSVYTVIASGVSERKEAEKDQSVWTITAEDVRDFTMVIGEGFAVVSDEIDGITINSYYYMDDKTDESEWGAAALEAGVDSVIAYGDAFGKYPYADLNVVETYLDAGGMEYPNLVMISDSMVYNSEDYSYVQLVVAHEIGHQWFYGIVGNDPYNEAWLDESFASYCEYVYQDTFMSQNELDEIVEDGASGYISPINLAYDDFDSDYDYYIGVYVNGQHFLYALRQAMGEDEFNAAISEYFEKYAFQIATEEDLIEIINAHAKGNEDVEALMSAYLQE